MRFAYRAAVYAALLAAVSPARADQAHPALPPLPYAVLKQLRQDPAAWQQFRAEHANPKPVVKPLQKAQPATVGAAAWSQISTGAAISNAVVLTDGSVMAHESCSGTWLKLRPDNTGSYAKGTWTTAAPMPNGYAPRFFASAVLPDGRMIVEGGEYNGAGCDSVWTTQGAIYDPQTDTWADVPPPAGWTTIGDASGIVLPDGRFMLSNCCTTQAAILDPVTLTWTAIGSGKLDINDEENWTLLPNGNLLTVDANYNSPPPPCGTASEQFSPATGTWTSAGSTVRRLSGCYGAIKTYEAPTQVLLPTGFVYAFGATNSLPVENHPVPTAKFNSTTSHWSAGPFLPQIGGINYTMSDAPAAVQTNGTMLLAASPATWTKFTEFPSPTHFFVFDGVSYTQLPDLPDSAALSAYEVNFLVLPTGDIFGTETDYGTASILPAACCVTSAWRPQVNALSSTSLAPGSTYKLQGTQLSGLTQGASLGDDGQADTNFPLVRIVNKATQHVAYARTFGFTRSVKRATASATSFTLPASIESGASTLYVVANGIASVGTKVTVTP